MIKKCYLGYEISKLVNVLHYIYRQPSMTKRDLKLLDQCYLDIEEYLKRMDLSVDCDDAH